MPVVLAALICLAAVSLAGLVAVCTLLLIVAHAQDDEDE